MLDHGALKLVHQACATLSITGFLLRGGLMLKGSALLRARWMRTWPHAIDSLLLISGIWMAVNLHVDPVNSPWLAAKLVALLVYIGLGFLALRLGKSYRLRVIALIGALACVAYIALVALTRSPLPL